MNLVKTLIALVTPKTVASALKGVQKAIDKLDAAAEHAVSSKDIISNAISQLHDEWDNHNEEHRRAVAVSTKLKDLIS
ncbi:hypothetical protein [Luteibacter sp. ME-Dv--P-043b]|uniref:hypothetical protein n=1 Tax=Luteibacter sp. ME-Dv--P-043b TaxID=3040291 RepID=UPI002554CE9C|nr:hypothetical protein [Luteibacter sp. ME-Dv--P-043b]